MVRGLIWSMTAALLCAGLGCGSLHQSDSTTTVISPPVKVTNEFEPPAATQDDIDPERMALTGKEWSWVRTVYNNDTIVVPAKPGVFTLTFNNQGIVNVGTDCNRMTGSYNKNGRLLSIGKLAATRMSCPNSQETVFADMLSQISAFLFTSEGELILELKFDTGQAVFK